MIELVFVACLSAAPATCSERSLQFADMPMMGCMTSGQTLLAQWVNEHQDWQIRRWSCRPIGAVSERNA